MCVACFEVALDVLYLDWSVCAFYLTLTNYFYIMFRTRIPSKLLYLDFALIFIYRMPRDTLFFRSEPKTIINKFHLFLSLYFETQAQWEHNCDCEE